MVIGYKEFLNVLIMLGGFMRLLFCILVNKGIRVLRLYFWNNKCGLYEVYCNVCNRLVVYKFVYMGNYFLKDFVFKIVIC